MIEQEEDFGYEIVVITNKYLIVNLNDEHLNHILDCTVESLETARRSLDNNKIVVKLPYDSEEIPECCVHLQQYTHSEILTIMNSSEWTDPNIF